MQPVYDFVGNKMVYNKVKYNKENNNVELNNLTRESLVTAVIILMETQPYRKISITDICKKAGVSRNAFYRNYPKKDAIMRYYLFKITEDYRKKLRETRTEITAYDMFYNLLLHMKNNKKLIDALYSADLTYLLIDTVFLAFRDCFMGEDHNYKECHFAGSFYAICMNWLYNDGQRPASEVTELILKFNNIPPDTVFPLNPVTDMVELMNKYNFVYRE